MDRNLEEEQAWDEYCELQKDWNKKLELFERVKLEIKDWLDEEKIKYEKAIAALMPYVKERIMFELEENTAKYQERHIEPLGKDNPTGE